MIFLDFVLEDIKEEKSNFQGKKTFHLMERSADF